MSDSGEKNAKILKTIVIFIVVFFLFIIVFNIWMKASLEKSGAFSSSKAVSGKPEIKKPAATATEPIVSKQKRETTEKQNEGRSAGEEQLILQ